MAESLATVVVVPRERFSFALGSLDRLVAQTPGAPLIYVDGNAPRRVRAGIRRRARRHGFQVIRTRDYLAPNQARNLALPHVRTKYVAFVDNDVLVGPGWLPALVQAAEATGAAICSPLVLIGPEGDDTIHFAGADGRIVDRDGRRRFQEFYRFEGARLTQVHHLLRREPTELVEFHGVLVRMDVFEQLGPLDEALLSTHEYADLCLQVRQGGGTICYEPASVIRYTPPPPLALSDISYFLLRWSDDWTRRSLAHFISKWNLDPTDSGLDATRNYARWHRRLPWRWTWAACNRATGGRLERWKHIARPLEHALTRGLIAGARRRRSADAPAARG